MPTVGLTIACSIALHRSAGTRRAAATHTLYSRRRQAPSLGMSAGQFQACTQIPTKERFKLVEDDELTTKL